ncbi:MAG: class I tRNA ligase family protein [Candidatus Saccharibacteria bacterium]
MEPGKVREDLPFVERDAIIAIVRNPKDNTYLGLRWKEVEWTTFITGGVEAGQTAEEAARQEVSEETGYKNLKLVKTLDYRVHAKFHHVPKGENRFAHFHAFLFELTDSTADAVSENELKRHESVWFSEAEALRSVTAESQIYAFQAFRGNGGLYAGEGIVINSGQYDGKDSGQVRHEIAAQFGQEKVQYKLRDWLVSRQRYWGAPIPIVYDPEGNPHPIPEENLPWMLPKDVEFKPTGKSPLTYSKEFIERTEKIFGAGWRPEYDTMDTFVDSSWYFLRFADPHNDREFAARPEIEKWLPVDMYLGGAEHAVLHLLYARFFTKVLFDLGYVGFEEPFVKLRNQGLILGPDGEKMSKSRGNVINPDEVIDQYGADAFRLYEMFMGPLMDAKPWSTDGIVGMSRFLDRVWMSMQGSRLGGGILEAAQDDQALQRITHKLVKKITEDIGALKFNTAISAFMTGFNDAKPLLSKNSVSQQALRSFEETYLVLLAPFAPHLTEELWHMLGHEESIHLQAWPKYDKDQVREEETMVVVQVLGRVRATLKMPANASQAEVKEAALADENVKRHLEGKQIVKEIFVQDKLINFVVR